jgi:hypothetical protein
MVGAGLNLALDAVLGLTFGVYGLALGTSVALAVVGVANVRRLGREFPPCPGTVGAKGAAFRRPCALQYAPIGGLVGLTSLFAASGVMALLVEETASRAIAVTVVSLVWVSLCLREIRLGR